MQCDCESSKCKHGPGACEEIPTAKVSAFGIKYNSCLLCAVQNCDVLEHVDQHSKGYEQGYNPLTGEVLIVFTPEDIQKALDVNNSTISEDDARKLASSWDNKIVDAMLHDWAWSLRDVLQDYAKDLPRFPTDEYGNIIPDAGQDGSIA